MQYAITLQHYIENWGSVCEHRKTGPPYTLGVLSRRIRKMALLRKNVSWLNLPLFFSLSGFRKYSESLQSDWHGAWKWFCVVVQWSPPVPLPKKSSILVHSNCFCSQSWDGFPKIQVRCRSNNWTVLHIFLLYQQRNTNSFFSCAAAVPYCYVWV